MNDSTLTVECKVHFSAKRHGRRQVTPGESPAPTPPPAGRVPRVSRLMALAIKLQGLVDRGEVKDYAELARLGHVSRARLTQIMNLLNLAPDIQEALLFLPSVESGRDSIKEWMVRPVAAERAWVKQRTMWRCKVYAPISL